MLRAATFDLSGTYRYSLVRSWEPALPRVCFVMLNPSTADGERDDPTIRRCIGFAQTWEYGSLEVVNLYAFRATHPTVLFRAPDPIGPENDHYVREAAGNASLVVVAWGNHGAGRAGTVLSLVTMPYCLGITARQEPRHPLYISASAEIRPYEAVRSIMPPIVAETL